MLAALRLCQGKVVVLEHNSRPAELGTLGSREKRQKQKFNSVFRSHTAQAQAVVVRNKKTTLFRFVRMFQNGILSHCVLYRNSSMCVHG